MNFKNLLTVTLICIGFTAIAHGQVVSRAHELGLSNFSAPTTANSTIAFKKCNDCELISARVTAATRYSVNGDTVRLEDFREAITLATDPDNASVVVLHHLESDTVVSIDLSI